MRATIGLTAIAVVIGTFGCTKSSDPMVPDANFDFDAGPGVDAGRADGGTTPVVDECTPEGMGSTVGMPCADGNVCQDGCFCNGIEVCQMGVCAAGADPCPDEQECTTDVCLEETDQCFHEPQHEMCSDGDACNGTEQCDPLVGCRANAPLYCNDENSCTVDSCDPAEGCVFVLRDLDGDGFVDGRCGGDDCDDDPRFGADIYPGAEEDCTNRRDDDCNGLRDFNDPGCLPSNGTCEEAEVLPGAGTYSGSTQALMSNYTLACGGTGPDAVFRFTLEETQDIRVSIAGGGTSVAVTLRRWDDCATGPEEKCNAASPPTLLRRSAPPGEYAIIVKTSTGSPFDLNLMLSEPTEIPPVDICNAGTVDVTDGGSYTGMFPEVEDDYSLSCHGGSGWRDAAYRFEIDTAKDVTISGSTTGGFFSTTFLSLVTTCSDPTSTLTCISGNPAMIRRRGLPPGEYFILLESSRTDATEWNLDVSIEDVMPRTEGDACSDPLELTDGGGASTVDLTRMEFDFGTSCGGTSPTAHRDAVFSFTLTEPRDVSLTTTAPGFHWMSIGTECGAFGSELRCRSGSSPLVNNFRSLAAGTYYVTVATSSTVGTVGASIVTSPATPIPPNDRCEGAIVIPPTGYMSLDTLVDFEDDVVGCVGGYSDAFYSLTLAARSRILVTASRPSGMTGNVSLTLRNACTDALNLACDTGSPSAVLDRTLDAGTYSIIVEMPTTALGDFNMDVFIFPGS